jgi:hypothetical protein
MFHNIGFIVFDLIGQFVFSAFLALWAVFSWQYRNLGAVSI